MLEAENCVAKFMGAENFVAYKCGVAEAQSPIIVTDQVVVGQEMGAIYHSRQTIGWARTMAGVWAPILRPHLSLLATVTSSTLFLPSSSESMQDAMRWCRHTPGGRSLDSIACALEAQRQPNGQLPQLIPDGLSPSFHLNAALALNHPFTLSPTATQAVSYAVRNSPECIASLIAQRQNMSYLLDQLACALADDNSRIIGLCKPSVQRVLRSGRNVKHIALMRELATICHPSDISGPIGMVLGLPMLGCAPHVRGLMDRIRLAETTTAEWQAHRQQHNSQVRASVKPSGDDALGLASWNKSLAELQRGVIEGPYNIDELPVMDASFVPRQGIWEMHGSATVPTVRNIDNLLLGGQNSTVTTFSAHRPTNADGLLAQARCVQSRFPCSQLSGWPSDYEKAFKQVPGCPEQSHLVVLLQWDPTLKRVCTWLAYSQLFGGKSPPLNFSRYPAWICEIVAVLFALGLSHCVSSKTY